MTSNFEPAFINEKKKSLENLKFYFKQKLIVCLIIFPQIFIYFTTKKKKRNKKKENEKKALIGLTLHLPTL